jgi:hypothetical protein
MSLPISEPIPSEPELSSNAPAPVRRRRSRHGLIPRELEQRAAFFGELMHQATPSIDFFLFSIAAGLVVGTALVLDSPALFILAALLSPFMAPVLGLSVAAAIGNLGFFLRSLAALFIGGALVFSLGLFAGWISLSVPGLAFTQAVYHTVFSWADLVVLLLGAGLTAFLAARSTQQKPLVSSVALAYELFLPLAAAGFGLVNPVPGLFPNGLILFASNLALAAVTAAFVLVLMGIRPLPSGASWLSSLFLMLVLVGAALLGVGNAAAQPAGVLPSITATPEPPTATLRLPTVTQAVVLAPTASGTPVPPSLTPTITATATATLIVTATSTISLTPSSTPVYGIVNAGEQNGVIIRPEPASALTVTSLYNGSLVEILPETVNKNGFIWIHVRTPDGKEGWVPQSLILTATPRPRN